MMEVDDDTEIEEKKQEENMVENAFQKMYLSQKYLLQVNYQYQH